MEALVGRIPENENEAVYRLERRGLGFSYFCYDFLGEFSSRRLMISRVTIRPLLS